MQLPHVLVAATFILAVFAGCAPAEPAQAPAGSAAPEVPASQPVGSAASGSASQPGTAAGIRLTLRPEGTEARYRAREQLAGMSLPNEAVGSTREVSGSIALTSDGSVPTGGSTIKVDLQSLQSDETRRDNWIKNNTLQVSRFPTAEFAARTVAGLGDIPSSGQRTFQLSGDLTVHGVTRPATWEVTAQFSPDRVSGRATTTVKLEDFGMTRPTVGPVLSIEESVVLEIEFNAART